LWNRTPRKIYTRLNSYGLESGQQIGLVATITEDDDISLSQTPNPVGGVILEADMQVELPDGSVVDVKMHDDGLHSDEGAHDGVYGATVVANEVGVYKAEAILSGTKSDGTKFVRTSEHLLPVVADETEFSGNAVGQMKDKERMDIKIYIDYSPSFSPLSRSFRGYTEVWGVDDNNNAVAICWLSSIVDAEHIGDNPYITLEMNMKWLSLAHAHEPLTLKNVLLQDADTFIPMSQTDEIPVKISSLVRLSVLKHFNTALTTNQITKEMKEGVSPPKKQNITNAQTHVMLVHGYCAESNPWSIYPGDWTNPIFYLSYKANVPNTKFAEMIQAHANSLGLDSFTLVGHSQGGMAALQLYNNYFSGLDNVDDGRIMQSIGTPYRGCSAAGSAANLGELFGVGCGANTDLTTDGAALWLNTISMEHRARIYYYTATYKLGNFFGDYCSMAMNAVLDWPNDGTTELERGQLNGAHNQGNTEKWCHTTSMKYPAQYHNRDLSRKMNAFAHGN